MALFINPLGFFQFATLEPVAQYLSIKSVSIKRKLWRFGVIGGWVTTEVFNRRLVNKNLLEGNYHNLHRILHLESKRKP